MLARRRHRDAQVRAKEINGEELDDALLDEYYEQRVDAGEWALVCGMNVAPLDFF